MQHIIESFKTAMYDGLGIAPTNIIADGQLHRFKDVKGKLNYWYNLHLDGHAAGVFGDWSTGTTIKWRAEGDYQKYTDQQRADFKIEAYRVKLIQAKEQQQRQKEAAKRAAKIWANTKTATAHNYLIKKQIKAHNARLHNDCLVIPIYNQKRLVSVQFINQDGQKKMLKGGLLKASYCVIGNIDTITPDSTLLICEGWATGASLFEETGYCVFVAFSAGNLKAIALQVKEHYPNHEIIIMGDNDYSLCGQTAATEAALSIDAKVSIPPDIGTDWNDYAIILKGASHE